MSWRWWLSNIFGYETLPFCKIQKNDEDKKKMHKFDTRKEKKYSEQNDASTSARRNEKEEAEQLIYLNYLFERGETLS